MRFPLLLLALFCGAVTAFAAPGGKVSGTVRDPGGKPLAGVVVTNGRDACRTGDDGTWTLPRNPVSPFVSVVTPADRRIDRFYLPLADDKADGYDFTLKPGEKKTEFRFMHLSDIEVGKSFRKVWLERIYETLRAGNYDFLFSSGDLCKEEGIRFHVEELGPDKTGIPLYTVIGNHDLDKVKTPPAEATYEKYLGPGYYAFEFGNVLAIAIPMRGDGPPRYRGADHARFLRNILALYPKEQPVLIFTHSLPYLCGTDLLVDPKGEKFDLGKVNVKGVFGGHSHTNDASLVAGRLPSFVAVSSRAGGCCGAPVAFREMHVAADGTVTGVQRIYHEKSGHFVVSTRPAGSVKLLATPFDTAKDAKEVCAVAGGRRLPLHRISRTSWILDGELPAESGDVEVIYADGSKAQASFRRAALPTAKPQLGSPWATAAGGNTRNTPPQLPAAAGKLTPLWTAAVPADFEYGSPIVAEGLVFVAASDDVSRREGGVYAFDAVTGEGKWFFRTGASVRNSPAYADGKVFFCDVENTVYAVQANNGAELWRAADPGLARAVGTNNAVMLEGGRVFAGSSNIMRALDCASGREIWRFDSAANGRRGGSNSSINQLVSDGKVLIAGLNWRGLLGIDLATGKEAWFNKDFALFHLGGGAIGDDGLLYCPVQSMAKIDPATGKTVLAAGKKDKRGRRPWLYHTSATPLVFGDTVYTGSAVDGLVALDRQTLAKKWSTVRQLGKSLINVVPYGGLPSNTVSTGPVLIGKVMWYGAADGCLHGVDPATGREVQKIDLGAPLTGMIAVSGNLVYTTDFAGRLHAFVAE